jgi:hypothetical protein
MIAQVQKVLINIVALASAAAIPLAHPTSAQTHRRLEIAPAVGGYMPYGGVPLMLQYSCLTGHPCPEVPSFEEARTVAVGGRVTVWLGHRWAIEGTGWYGSSHVTDVTQYTTEYVVYGGEGKIVLASLRPVVKVAAVQRMSILLMAGPAVSLRFDDGWAQWKKPTSGGGAVGVALDFHPRPGLGFRASIEDYVYAFESTIRPDLPSKFHHDFVFSLSMGPSFVGRSGKRR